MYKVIDDFFIKWEAELMEWYAEKKQEYSELGYKEWKLRNAEMSKQNKELIIHYVLNKRQGCTSIEEIVEKDMAHKKAVLIQKIKNKVGEVLEVNLYCGEDGTPNGYVKGTEKTVTISTIVAGGYNIQCLHYRVLVK